MARSTQPELARSRTPMTRSSTVLGIHVYRRTVGEPVPLPTRVPTVTMASTPMAHTVKVSVGVLSQCPSVPFLYARLQTGHIMVWWCLSRSPTESLSRFPSWSLALHPSVTVFCTFLLHALTYEAEILYVTLFLWTFDQVRVPSISVYFPGSYAPFGT